MFIYSPHHIATCGFMTITFVEKFIKVWQIVNEYIVKAKMQRDNHVKNLKVEIQDEFVKDIHELISPSLEAKSILLYFSSMGLTSRVGVA